MHEVVTDSLVILKRNLIRFRRQPEMLAGYTIQPIMFVLLFVYVFGGSINTGMDYVDFLIPGILVQNITFGGALTAVGLVEDLNKGLIDRFRSLPMARSAVLDGPHAGRRRGQHPDDGDRDHRRPARRLQLQRHDRPERALRALSAVALRLRIQLVVRAHRPRLDECRKCAAVRFHPYLPAHLHLFRVRAGGQHATGAGGVREGESVHHHGGRDAPPVRGHAGRATRCGERRCGRSA